MVREERQKILDELANWPEPLRLILLTTIVSATMRTLVSLGKVKFTPEDVVKSEKVIVDFGLDHSEELFDALLPMFAATARDNIQKLADMFDLAL